MGYYTRYKITTDDDMVVNYIPTIHAVSGFSLEESCSWYEHERDMRRVSRTFPDVTFRVDGTGEEAGDIWVKWFKDGKMAVWRLEFEVPKGFGPPEGFE